jgi:uncharacterized membrane protein YjjP (DUF1212 family)
MSSFVSDFLRVTSECGKRYMATGGPTSRLEEKIAQSGKALGYDCDVYATPTAMFVYARDGQNYYMTMERVVDTQTNFTDMIFYDSLLEKLSTAKITIQEASARLEGFVSRRYSFPTVVLSAFLIGFFASFPKYGHFVGAASSGVITALVYLLNRPLARKFKFSGIFNDFIGSLFSFIVSVALATFFEVPVAMFVIGTILLIVPGLTLTSAVSDIAEHNFVSGTVKIMKSILILIAIGVAYILMDNMFVVLALDRAVFTMGPAKAAYIDTYWFQFLCRMILISSFCVFFHMPKRAIPGAILCGISSILVLDQFVDPNLFVMASFLASLTVGVFSLALGQLFKWPSQVFSTMGILSLVPGLLALSSLYNLMETADRGAIAYQVALTAGAITFGLLTARMPFRFYNSVRNLPIQ